MQGSGQGHRRGGNQRRSVDWYYPWDQGSASLGDTGSRKSTNIHRDGEVLAGGPGGINGGVLGVAGYYGGVFIHRAVPGKAVQHFEKK